MQTFTHTQRVIQGVCGWDRSHGVLLNHICDCDPPLDPLEDWGPLSFTVLSTYDRTGA